MLVVQPYSPVSREVLLRKIPFREREFTFVVNVGMLSEKTGRLLRNKGINRFEREGGVVREYSSDDAIEPLLDLYAKLVARKGFRPYGGDELIRGVWRVYRESANPVINARLIRAEIGSKTASCCLVIRVNRTAHFLWAASNHELRNLGSGEAMQWHLMQQLRSIGVELYDLEGADKKRNPGVYDFKAKLGGQLVARAPAGFMVL
jgi:hypothetical protein